jgi:hypothetical protein
MMLQQVKSVNFKFFIATKEGLTLIKQLHYLLMDLVKKY